MGGYKGPSGKFQRVPLEERFWNRVDKSAGPNGCWLWTGATEWNGYGRITDYWNKYLTHRVSYEMSKGPIPPGKSVCHSCDNPPCVNPKHLWLGTSSENMQDAIRKGRKKPAQREPLRGTASSQAVLTNRQVRRIREIYDTQGQKRQGHPSKGSNTVSVRTLAERYGVSPSLIHAIVKRKAWPHIK